MLRRGILVQYLMNRRCQTPFELKVETQIFEEKNYVFFFFFLMQWGLA